MPYGISKDAGGDSKKNVDNMHKCVEEVMAKGKDKVSAIRICKASMFGSAVSVGKYLDELSEKSEIICRILQGGQVTLNDEERDVLELIIENLNAATSEEVEEEGELQAVKFMEFDDDGNLVVFTMGPEDQQEEEDVVLTSGD
jgi:hypothetical protein